METNTELKPKKPLPLISLTSHHRGKLYFCLHSSFTCSRGEVLRSLLGAVFHIWWSFSIIGGKRQVFEYGS